MTAPLGGERLPTWRRCRTTRTVTVYPDPVDR